MNTFTKVLKFSSLAAFVVLLANCQGKQTTTDKNADANAAAATAAPAIESSPMSFDPAGSDSGKIEGLQTVHFDYDKSSLKDAEKKKENEDKQAAEQGLASGETVSAEFTYSMSHSP